MLIQNMRKRFAFLLASFVITVTSFAQSNWPPVTNTTRPWTRWWWEGSAVSKEGLTWNLQQYRDAGLGGVEITPIYGIHGYEGRFIDFLSPQWMQMLVHTLNESKRLDLGVDLANATGWPFGGPWVSDADASKTVYYKTYTLNGGEQLKETIEFNREAMVRTANNKPAAVDSILNPVAKNKNLQALALDQIQYPGRLPIRCVMAYSDDGKTIELTANIDNEGHLNWSAPDGKWTIYALFEGLHGKMVERAAPGGEGYAIDHFSAPAARNYFKKFDEAFTGYNLSYLRGFFNDSYEVDDARGQANWTSGLFEEFTKRKGYDLKQYLPALFGKDNAEKNSRVIYDYRSVIDELILENFTKEWKKWGASKGKILRNQSHGSPANTLDLYSVVDIPETEGTDILRFKFATSAAHVTGKKLVSSESATWLNEHFLSSWGDVKKAIDLYFLGGVNHIIYHGTEYSPKDAPWPGWLFYAAVHFQPTNPQWKDFHALNKYITRTQSFLQLGKPDNDILLYYPIADRYSEPGNILLQHFDGMERNFERTDFEHAAKWLLEKGYTFDFFSDRQLQNFSMSGNSIVSGGNKYKAILLPGNKLVPEETMTRIIELAKQGAVVLFYKNIPADVPGLNRAEERRAGLKKLIDELPFQVKPGGLKWTLFPKGGALFCSDDLGSMLTRNSIRHEQLVDAGIQFTRRTDKDTTYYFIVNTTAKAFDEWQTVNGRYNAVLVFDPMTGRKGRAKSTGQAANTTKIRMQLQPGESIILKCFNSPTIRAERFQYMYPNGKPQNIAGKWTVEFLTGGPTLPAKKILDTPGSWTALTGDDVKNFSGTAKYSVSFKKPAGSAQAWLLDLGKVNETAEVILNGKKIATLIGPAFQCMIPASSLLQTNKLEIIVASLMANRIAYMDRNNIPWKIFYNTNMPARRRENIKNGLFDASAWAPLPSGLSGPVTLTPVTQKAE